MKRYEKNIGTINSMEQSLLSKAKVCIVGCGGLGGYIIEMLARLGIGNLTVVDFDIFEESNLNRQIFAQEQNLENKKVEECEKRVHVINREIKVVAVDEKVTKNNAEAILKNHDIVIDALDSISDRMILQDTCEKLGIPLVFGAISQWLGQVGTILPGDKTLNKIYPCNSKNVNELTLGNNAFMPALVGSIQVSETIKILLNKGGTLKGKVLLINLLDNEFKTLL